MRFFNRFQRDPIPLTETLRKAELEEDFDDYQPAWEREEREKRREELRKSFVEDERNLRITAPQVWAARVRKIQEERNGKIRRNAPEMVERTRETLRQCNGKTKKGKTKNQRVGRRKVGQSVA